ncbi:hypothetical protein ACS8Y6_04275 [Salinisphaera sp. RV14]|uniref:hypothetical protein n=1 Tax=Salinisphaera sp. RV14 TaxID=3454140 RepID=UPI003F82A53E
MKTRSNGPAEAVASINDAIREASSENRGHTTVFPERKHIEVEDLERIVKHFRERGFTVEERCHARNTFALKVSWYPAQHRSVRRYRRTADTRHDPAAPIARQDGGQPERRGVGCPFQPATICGWFS